MDSAAEADTLMSMLARPVINDAYNDKKKIMQLRDEFAATGYIKLPMFINGQVFGIIHEEVKRTFELSSRKDFIMGEYKTPRNLYVVGGEQILRCSSLLPVLYGNYDIRHTLSEIIDEKIFGVYHKHEFMVGNYLEKNGDTHGWHLDDPRYALIIILESPPPEIGGNVQYISNWNDFCRQNGLDPFNDIGLGLQKAEMQSLIREASHVSGDCYLLKAGECLHRVTPLNSHGFKRRVLNMAFDNREVIPFGETANKLYGVLSEFEGY